MRIRALSVFEGVVYHCAVVDRSSPCRPTLEVEAVLRDGDAAGPLLLTLADYALMAGGPEVIRPCLPGLSKQGRIVTHLDVAHLAFPTWTPLDISGPRPARPSPPTRSDDPG